MLTCFHLSTESKLVFIRLTCVVAWFTTVFGKALSLQQIVDGLNAQLGIGPRDLITILQAIKAAGAIQADIEVM